LSLTVLVIKVLFVPCLENCQKCPNFKVNDKMAAVTAKRTIDSCSPCQN